VMERSTLNTRFCGTYECRMHLRMLQHDHQDQDWDLAMWKEFLILICIGWLHKLQLCIKPVKRFDNGSACCRFQADNGAGPHVIERITASCFFASSTTHCNDIHCLVL
jgi:hypothetical protein